MARERAAQQRWHGVAAHEQITEFVVFVLLVKEWLVRRYNMNPAKLETMGRGSQELLVSGGNVEDQAPNRRVEVLLRPSGPAQGSRPAKKGN